MWRTKRLSCAGKRCVRGTTGAKGAQGERQIYAEEREIGGSDEWNVLLAQEGRGEDAAIYASALTRTYSLWTGIFSHGDFHFPLLCLSQYPVETSSVTSLSIEVCPLCRVHQEYFSITIVLHSRPSTISYVLCPVGVVFWVLRTFFYLFTNDYWKGGSPLLAEL